MTYFPSVFIGGTYEHPETERYRSIIKDAALAARMNPIMFEHYRWQFVGGSPTDLTKEMIDSADIFLGLYLGVYGSRTIDGMDFGELEYEYAFSRHKPALLFFPSKFMEMPLDEKSLQFKRKVEKNTFYQTFNNLDHLSAQTTSLLLRKKLDLSLEDRLVVDPLWKKPAKHSQYDADIFMIMPFASPFTKIWEACIKPLVESHGLTIKRGDDFYNINGVMDDVWTATYRAKVVIADCTGANPNVFYELGITHTLGRDFILLTQNPQDIPFDIRTIRTIHYSPDDYDDLKRKLTSALHNLGLVKLDSK